MVRLPSPVRVVGTISATDKVYIEDYVYSYLNEIRVKKNGIPMKIALYGYSGWGDDGRYYVIYGAASEEDALGQVKEKFFSDYKFLGYIKFGKNADLSDKKKGYYIFCENNEAMQNYMISCFERSRNEENVKYKDNKPKTGYWRMLIQRFFIILFIFISAIAVLTIGNYERMKDFTYITAWAIQKSEE